MLGSGVESAPKLLSLTNFKGLTVCLFYFVDYNKAIICHVSVYSFFSVSQQTLHLSPGVMLELRINRRIKCIVFPQGALRGVAEAVIEAVVRQHNITHFITPSVTSYEGPLRCRRASLSFWNGD